MREITSIEMREFRLACSNPLQTATGTIKERYGYLFCLKTENHIGLGEASPLPGWTESFKACKAALHHSIESIEERGVERTLYDLRETPAARHGVSLACQDLQAKVQDVPLYQVLQQENSTVETVAVNKTMGSGGLDKMLREAREAMKRGFSTLKIKAGREDFCRDIERLQAVRETVGNSINLRVDTNGQWEQSTIEKHANTLRRLHFEYVEQPLASDQLDEHSQIREIFPVALDESLYSEGIEPIFESDAADYLVLKPMCLGGLDRCLKYAEKSRAQHLKPVITNTIDAVVARTAAIHLSAALENLPPSGLATAGFLKEDLCRDPAVPFEGRVAVPQDPGIGVDRAWYNLG